MFLHLSRSLRLPAAFRLIHEIMERGRNVNEPSDSAGHAAMSSAALLPFQLTIDDVVLIAMTFLSLSSNHPDLI